MNVCNLIQKMDIFKSKYSDLLSISLYHRAITVIFMHLNSNILKKKNTCNVLLQYNYFIRCVY